MLSALGFHSAHGIQCKQFLKVNHVKEILTFTQNFKTQLMVEPHQEFKSFKKGKRVKKDRSRSAKEYRTDIKPFAVGKMALSLQDTYTDFSNPKYRSEFVKSSKKTLNLITSLQKSLAVANKELNNPLGIPPHFTRTAKKFGIFNAVEGSLYIKLEAEDAIRSDEELQKTYTTYLKELKNHLDEQQKYIDGLHKMMKIRNIRN